MKAIQDKVQEQKDLLKACNKDINMKLGQRKKLHKEGNDGSNKVTEVEYKVTKCRQDNKDSTKQVNRHGNSKVT